MVRPRHSNILPDVNDDVDQIHHATVLMNHEFEYVANRHNYCLLRMVHNPKPVRSDCILYAKFSTTVVKSTLGNTEI